MTNSRTAHSLVLGLGLSCAVHLGILGLLREYGDGLFAADAPVTIELAPFDAEPVAMLPVPETHDPTANPEQQPEPEAARLDFQPEVNQPPPPSPLQPPPPPPPEPEVKLGINDSDDTKTAAWQGFAKPTDHAARKSSVEQSAMAFKPGGAATPPAPSSPDSPEPRENSNDSKRAKESDATESPDATRPTEQQTSPATDAASRAALTEAKNPSDEATDAKPAAATESPEKPPSEGEVGASKSVGNNPPFSKAGPPLITRLPLGIGEIQLPQSEAKLTFPAPAPQLIKPSPFNDAKPLDARLNPLSIGDASRLSSAAQSPTNSAAPRSPTPTRAMSPPASRPRPSSSDRGERDAIQTDRESDATSLEEPIEIRPGQVKAARGLEIRTVHPQWSVLTLLTARPRNAVVRIKFGRKGDVIKAEFMPNGKTGAAMVDEPLLDAVYRWTAKGEALTKIPEDDSRAGVTIVMRILLSER